MSNEAVIVIDVQNAVLDFPGMKRPIQTRAALDGLVTRIATLIERARSCNVPVLSVQHDGRPGHRLERASLGWQIRPQLTPLQSEPVIHKAACDAFFGTTLLSELKARNNGRLIVAGCMTQYCIDTSVPRAVSLGYDVALVEDGH